MTRTNSTEKSQALISSITWMNTPIDSSFLSALSAKSAVQSFSMLLLQLAFKLSAFGYKKAVVLSLTPVLEYSSFWAL